MSRLNDATPADWDRVRKAHPAIERTPKSSLKDYKPYISMAMQEAHDMLIEENPYTVIQERDVVVVL